VDHAGRGIPGARPHKRFKWHHSRNGWSNRSPSLDLHDDVEIVVVELCITREVRGAILA
jgi:hypothetical protein